MQANFSSKLIDYVAITELIQTNSIWYDFPYNLTQEQSQLINNELKAVFLHNSLVTTEHIMIFTHLNKLNLVEIQNTELKSILQSLYLLPTYTQHYLVSKLQKIAKSAINVITDNIEETLQNNDLNTFNIVNLSQSTILFKLLHYDFVYDGHKTIASKYWFRYNCSMEDVKDLIPALLQFDIDLRFMTQKMVYAFYYKCLVYYFTNKNHINLLFFCCHNDTNNLVNPFLNIVDNIMSTYLLKNHEQQSVRHLLAISFSQFLRLVDVNYLPNYRKYLDYCLTRQYKEQKRLVPKHNALKQYKNRLVIIAQQLYEKMVDCLAQEKDLRQQVARFITVIQDNVVIKTFAFDYQVDCVTSTISKKRVFYNHYLLFLVRVLNSTCNVDLRVTMLTNLITYRNTINTAFKNGIIETKNVQIQYYPNLSKNIVTLVSNFSDEELKDTFHYLRHHQSIQQCSHNEWYLSTNVLTPILTNGAELYRNCPIDLTLSDHQILQQAAQLAIIDHLIYNNQVYVPFLDQELDQNVKLAVAQQQVYYYKDDEITVIDSELYDIWMFNWQLNGQYYLQTIKDYYSNYTMSQHWQQNKGIMLVHSSMFGFSLADISAQINEYRTYLSYPSTICTMFSKKQLLTITDILKHCKVNRTMLEKLIIIQQLKQSTNNILDNHLNDPELLQLFKLYFATSFWLMQIVRYWKGPGYPFIAKESWSNNDNLFTDVYCRNQMVFIVMQYYLQIISQINDKIGKQWLYQLNIYENLTTGSQLTSKFQVLAGYGLVTNTNSVHGIIEAFYYNNDCMGFSGADTYKVYCSICYYLKLVPFITQRELNTLSYRETQQLLQRTSVKAREQMTKLMQETSVIISNELLKTLYPIVCSSNIKPKPIAVKFTTELSTKYYNLQEQKAQVLKTSEHITDIENLLENCELHSSNITYLTQYLNNKKSTLHNLTNTIAENKIVTVELANYCQELTDYNTALNSYCDSKTYFALTLHYFTIDIIREEVQDIASYMLQTYGITLDKQQITWLSNFQQTYKSTNKSYWQQSLSDPLFFDYQYPLTGKSLPNHRLFHFVRQCALPFSLKGNYNDHTDTILSEELDNLHNSHYANINQLMYSYYAKVYCYYTLLRFVNLKTDIQLNSMLVQKYNCYNNQVRHTTSDLDEYQEYRIRISKSKTEQLLEFML